MDWFTDLFTQHSAIQAVVVLSLISVFGMMLGKVRFFGISLGVTFVFFIGIAAGHFGLSVDPSMLAFAESFGLVLFVYALGLQVGPGFFSSLRSGGIRLVSLATLIVLTGSALAVGLGYATRVPMSDMAGILCGATTNTPALGAAQQMLSQMQLDSNNATLGCALTYPLGVVGVILGIIAVRKLFARPSDIPQPDAEHKKNIFIVEFKISNPGVVGKSIRDVAAYSHHHFVISRLWRAGQVSIPTSDSTLESGDLVLVITSPDDVQALELLFGERVQKDWNTHDIDWNALDSQLISRSIIVTRPEINGRKLSSLRLRNLYGINISRVHRSGVQLLATPDLTLQLGDSLTVVGEAQAIEGVEKILGNAVKQLDEPNLIPVFIGLLLGLLLGSIPFAVPGISLPVKLGLAGGPIILGILIGTFGPRIHIVTYTTLSANLMLRALGLSLYLACLGLEAGAHFVETIMRPEGMLWIGLGFLLTFVPIVIVAAPGPMSSGAHFAKVQVDTVTGGIKVLEYAAVHDVGRVVNPMGITGQLEGGISMGLGYALCEEMKLDSTGRNQTSSFKKYHILNVKEMPKLSVDFLDSEEETGPYGAKSIGECAVVPVAPAIANAVSNAVGRQFYKLPIRPEDVLEALSLVK